MQIFSIHNKVEETAGLASFIDEVAEAYCIAPDVVFQLNLAMDEALANSVNYAYPDGVDGIISLEAEKEGDRIVFRLIDQGVAFDPTQDAKEVDTTLSVEDRPIGGLGIFLIKQTMDEVTYCRQGDKNILTMKKKI